MSETENKMSATPANAPTNAPANEDRPVILHTPVMLEEILELFSLVKRKDALVVDCTLGAGGHAEAILSRYSSVRYVGIDADPEARERAMARLHAFAERLTVLPGYFDEALEALKRGPDFEKPDFILFDLGVSMHHLVGSGRGFSYSSDEALDMRFSPEAEATAADIVNRCDEKELADILYLYGEERYSRRIARAIVEARKGSAIKTASRLASIIAGAVPSDYRHGRIHPATRTFQALRIKVNNELEREEKALYLAAGILAPGGILAVISFHSLEDRIAKRVFRDCSQKDGLELLFRKPSVPSAEESAKNPASRSAKLRALRVPLQEGGAQ